MCRDDHDYPFCLKVLWAFGHLFIVLSEGGLCESVSLSRGLTRAYTRWGTFWALWHECWMGEDFNCDFGEALLFWFMELVFKFHRGEDIDIKV